MRKGGSYNSNTITCRLWARIEDGESGMEAPGPFAQRIQHWYVLRACHLVWSGELLAWRLWFVIPSAQASPTSCSFTATQHRPQYGTVAVRNSFSADSWHMLTVLQMV